MSRDVVDPGMSRTDPLPPEPTADAAARVVELLRGFVVAKTLYLAADLGLADLLSDGPLHATDLAARANADVDAVTRVVEALCSVDVFVENGDGRYGLGPLGHALRTGVRGSVRNWVLANGGPIFRAFADAGHTVRTGRPAYEVTYGTGFFEFLEHHPDERAVFDAAMDDRSRQAAEALVEAYDFDGVGTVVDVGGGSGTLLKVILERHRGIDGVLFDRPEVVEAAAEGVARAGLDARCRLVGGSFFEAVPTGGDLYVLSWILHDWQDAEAATILRACRRAMTPGSRLLVLEAILPPGHEPHISRFGDIVMLVALGGRERTLAAYEGLLAASGFRLERTIAIRDPRTVLEAVAGPIPVSP